MPAAGVQSIVLTLKISSKVVKGAWMLSGPFPFSLPDFFVFVSSSFFVAEVRSNSPPGKALKLLDRLTLLFRLGVLGNEAK